MLTDEIAGWRLGLEALRAPIGRYPHRGEFREWARRYLIRRLDRDRSSH